MDMNTNKHSDKKMQASAFGATAGRHFQHDNGVRPWPCHSYDHEDHAKVWNANGML
jgi:predicted transposase YbfD/YdcC